MSISNYIIKFMPLFILPFMGNCKEIYKSV